jgi:hypothetical protein
MDVCPVNTDPILTSTFFIVADQLDGSLADPYINAMSHAKKGTALVFESTSSAGAGKIEKEGRASIYRLNANFHMYLPRLTQLHVLE